MADFTPGDVVVLKSGSMRMLVESIEGDAVRVVWANDGGIGRETLPAFALNKWEDRGPREDRPAPRPRPRRDDDEGDRPARKPYGEKKAYGDKPHADKKPYGDRKPAGDRPPRTGMDGKPKQKTFYRKDD